MGGQGPLGGHGGRADLLVQLDSLGTNLLRVTPGETFLGADAKLPTEAPSMLRRIGPVEWVAATGGTDASVRRTDLIPEAETGGISVLAADPELLGTLRGELAAGRFLNRATARYQVVVLGAKAAERLGVTATGRQVWLGGRWFTVVGILRPVALASEIDRAARAAANSAVTSLLLGLGAVALLVGGVGIANVMVISVLERRSEIGLRRALGAPRGPVGLQFLAESMLRALAGGLAGVALGAAVTAVYAAGRGWSLVVPVPAMAGGILAALAIGAVAGLYPALRAARLAPTDALRTV